MRKRSANVAAATRFCLCESEATATTKRPQPEWKSTTRYGNDPSSSKITVGTKSKLNYDI
ncbi:hypothetical protein [Lysinibacillus sp. NPDC056232]|uniref:hypothetical protein n=1 Tax=Lysinibacillus sp. NPDC056232 TaxID=3345756 RepID=UPI0035D7BF1D